MKNCYCKGSNCRNCNIYLLKKKYIELIPTLKSEENCHHIFRSIAFFLFNLLSRSPNAYFGSDAHRLIDSVNERLAEEDLRLGMKLCSATIQCFLFLGLNKRNIDSTSKLLTYYKIYLNRYYIFSSGEDYVAAYCDYHSLLFQFHHLIDDFSYVTREYESTLFLDDIIQVYGDRIISQYSASKYLGSITRSEKKLSREIAENLMSNVQTRGIIEGSEFFIIAKYSLKSIVSSISYPP